jgi:vesicle coat complex subunit
MGYRSLVAYTIRFVGNDDKKSEQSFNTFLAEAKSKIPALWMRNEEHTIHEWLKIDASKLQFNFHTPHDIKWYPDYKEVQAHEQLWELAREFNEDNNTIVGQMFIVGEEADDINQRAFGELEDDYIRLNREITCDWLDKKVE